MKLPVLLIASVALLSACGGSGGDSTTPATQKVSISEVTSDQLVYRKTSVITVKGQNLNLGINLSHQGCLKITELAGSTATPPQPLPENLEKLASGEHGVILASFGSIAYNMPAHLAIKFLEAYGRLNETVLTKMAVPAGVKVSSAKQPPNICVVYLKSDIN